MSSLAGKVALITGGARGIGQAFAGRLAADGADLVVVDLAPAPETQALIERHGRQSLVLQADVSSPEAVAGVHAAVAERFGGIDILVNNAGWVSEDSFESLDYATWKRIFAVNVDSVFLFTQAFAPTMKAKRWGRVLNMCSNMLGLNVPAVPHYIATKAAVLGCTRAFASALGEHGITVNALSPGLTRTPGTQALQTIPGTADSDAGTDARPSQFAVVAAMQSIRREAVPDDLLGAMAFFVSEEAGFITGQNLIVDGGLVRAV